MANPYHVYMNTMVFAIVLGVISLVLLLALIYVPSVSQYSILILTTQVGLIAIIIQALIRISSFHKDKDRNTPTTNKDTLSVGFCPDYMIAKPNGANVAGGTTCLNKYSNNQQIWLDPIDTTTGAPKVPLSVDLSSIDGKGINDVCQAANALIPVSTILKSSVMSVPWTELRSRCTSYQ